MKLIIFDLDGVLIDTKNIHYESLNRALEEIDAKYKITIEEHLKKYDGLKTNQKLSMLTEEKGLPKSYHKIIWNRKQEITLNMLEDVQVNQTILNCLKFLSKDYKIVCCSNSIRKTIVVILNRLGIIEYFDLIISNEDVGYSKPHPEMYWKAMSYFGLTPEETLIVEDSPHGLLAANRANTNILRVDNSKEITLENILNKINKIKNHDMKIPKWKNEKLNILIPMAGAGSRFENAGYTFPKPLIDVNGKPMIQVVVDNLNIDANYIYVVQKKHREKYNLDTLLNLITPNCKIVEVDGLTEGAACTALLAKKFINTDSPLFFANSDQYVEWDSNEFMYKMTESECDGGIVTFKSIHPKWSFAKLDNEGYVSEVAEKNPISDNATVGYYYWKKGSDFVKYAEQMIEENKRVNNEFYVCPVFNQAITDGKKIKIYESKKMWGLGTPEDLKTYLENF